LQRNFTNFCKKILNLTFDIRKVFNHCSIYEYKIDEVSRHIRSSTLEKNLILFSINLAHAIISSNKQWAKSIWERELFNIWAYVSFDMRLHHLYTHQFNTKINQPLVRQQK
jgi:hypothetical protein